METTIIPIYYKSLREVPGHEGSLKRQCPFCKDGVLPLTRSSVTLAIQDKDHCLSCGQWVRWLDIDELRAREESKSEAAKLCEIIRHRHLEGKPVQQDVATHALLLVRNGWPADKALEESKRTLDDAELEGGY